jgi:hypothetical protein
MSNTKDSKYKFHRTYFQAADEFEAGIEKWVKHIRFRRGVYNLMRSRQIPKEHLRFSDTMGLFFLDMRVVYASTVDEAGYDLAAKTKDVVAVEIASVDNEVFEVVHTKLYTKQEAIKYLEQF